MNITEFAKERGINQHTVAQYIRRHPEIFSGHTTKIKKDLILDEKALAALDIKYPPQQVVIVTEDEELKAKYNKLQEEFIAVQAENNALHRERANHAELIAAAQANELLITHQDAEIGDLKARLEELEAENDKLKNRGIIARLLNRY